MAVLAIIFCCAINIGFIQLTPTDQWSKPAWHTISQKLDYSNSENTTTWKMRYIENDEFLKSGGPIFIHLGGESEIDEWTLQNGHMYNMAQQNNATMYKLEHRYYGESYPTSNFSTENLRYLKSEFALEDFANFIRSTKKQYTHLANSKVIVFGGSYAGNLAVWMRQKYPELVYAAVASSAPILAKENFFEYNEVVKIRLGPKCSGVMQKAIEKTQVLLQSRKGRRKIEKDFGLCQPIHKHRLLEVLSFYNYVSMQLATTVQYGDQESVDQECNKLMNSIGEDDYSKLATYSTDQYDYSCTSIFDEIIYMYSDITLNTRYNRQWLYQKCTEFGYFKTSTEIHHLLKNAIPLKAYHKLCRHIFGASFTPKAIKEGIDRTNQMYGGLNPNVTRVIFLHGSMDPWHTLGLTKDLNPLSPTIIIEGTSHCTDMQGIDLSDSQALKDARTAVESQVEQWLRDNNI